MKKILIPHGLLKEALKKLALAHNSQSVLPVLEYVLVKIVGTDLILISTDLETTIQYTAQIEATEDFEMLLHYDDTKRICDFASGDLQICVEDSVVRIELVDTLDKFNIGKHPDIKDYPKMPALPTGSKSLTLSGSFIPTLKAAVKATSDDSLRPQLCHVLLDITPEAMNVVSTNTNILFLRKIEIETGKKAKVLVSKKAIKAMGDHAEVTLSWTDKNVFYVCENMTIVSVACNADYPDYNAVIPLHEESVKINLGPFRSALAKCLFIKGDDKVTTATITGPEIKDDVAEYSFKTTVGTKG